MATSMTGHYEFTETQNRGIGSLARKMRLVGLVAVVLGAVELILGLLLLIYAFRDQLPAEVLRRIPEDALKQLPPPSQLWAVVVQAATSALIFLLIGMWTRSAAREFQQIVDTRGQDISHLMNALGSLHKMYSLLYTIIVVGILAFLLSIGMLLYARFSGIPSIPRPETQSAGAPDVARASADVTRVSADLKDAFTSVTETLGEIKDAASAEAALPKLRGFSDKLDGIKKVFDTLSASGKAAIGKTAQGYLGTIKDLIKKVTDLAGPAKEKIAPVLNAIVEKLTSLTT
jgi:hypothetical protein